MRRRASAAVAATVIGICGVLWQAVPASQQPGWQVTDLDIGDLSDLDIAVDANGSAVAVWDKNQRVVGAAFSIVSGTWAPATMLSNSQDFSTRPRVEANAAGDAIAVWRGVRTSNGTPYVGLSRFSAATRTWSQVFELPANGYWPRAVIDANGDTTVVWAEWLREEMGYYYPYPVYEIRSARYEASTGSWSPVVTLSGEGVANPHLVIDGAGNVTAMWGGERVESVRWSIGDDSVVRGRAAGRQVLFCSSASADGGRTVEATWSPCGHKPTDSRAPCFRLVLLRGARRGSFAPRVPVTEPVSRA